MENMRVLFVSYLFPDFLEAKILQQDILPIQTQRFGIALLDALKNAFAGCIDIFSVAPLLDFPHSKLLIAPRAHWKFDDAIDATMAPFINIIGLKHLTRFLATFWFVFRWVAKHRNTKRVIVLHGVQSCKIWGVLLGQIFWPSITISFLTDELGVQPPWENKLLRLLRLVDVSLMKRGLQDTSGIIAMTKYLAEKFGNGRPTLIIPTIQNIERRPLPINTRSSDSVFTIVYTGGLSKDYGIDLLLNAFSIANNKDWQLLISGWGELEEAITETITQNPNIKFLGLLDKQKLSDLYASADVLVNPKISSTSFAKMSFPSKIVEYLGTGKPVISTNLPVYDENFKKHLILMGSDTPEELIRCLYEVSRWNKSQLEKCKHANIEFVTEELSPRIQGKKISEFIRKLSVSSINR